jgi:hypothetical protein
MVVCGLAVTGASIMGAGSVEAEEFHRLRTGEIRSRLAGMEVTDGVHWAEQYMRDGTFKAFHMGKPSKGKWLARNDELCLEGGPADTGCKQVWAAGNRIEFRTAGSALPAMEGVLQGQQARQ